MKISFSFVLFLIIFVYIIFFSRNKTMVGEAGDCYESWTCKGEEQCREKCKDEYKGIGRCDDAIMIATIPQCNCFYPCKYLYIFNK
ncbi:hypothetical protein Bca101_084841 [Brassica carinata]